MRFEHFALNVSDSSVIAQWYVAHLGFSIVRRLDVVPHTHFLADDSGRVIVEFYTNPSATIPNYATMHPLTFHLAVWSSDVKADRARLEQAGATLFQEEVLPNGSQLTMLRDPWGLPLQLCRRTNPFPRD